MEIFSSVFGRSKKSQNSGPKGGDDGPSDENFVVIKEQTKAPDSFIYPALNFDQLRVNNDQVTSSSNLTSPHGLIDKNLHVQPMDNIPFIVNPNIAAASVPSVDLANCFAVVDRVGARIANPISIDYYFHNERNFLDQYRNSSS